VFAFALASLSALCAHIRCAVRFFPGTTVLTADMMAQLNAWLSGYRTWKLIYRYEEKSYIAC
jgi:hypothetical protein